MSHWRSITTAVIAIVAIIITATSDDSVFILIAVSVEGSYNDFDEDAQWDVVL